MKAIAVLQNYDKSFQGLARRRPKQVASGTANHGHNEIVEGVWGEWRVLRGK